METETPLSDEERRYDKLADLLGEPLPSPHETTTSDSEVIQQEHLGDIKTRMKALTILGVNPSRAKIMAKLGLDEAELQQAQQTELESRLSSLLEQPIKPLVSNKRNYGKALSVLGVDASGMKASSKLGIEDQSEIEQAKQLMHQWAQELSEQDSCLPNSSHTVPSADPTVCELKMCRPAALRTHHHTSPSIHPALRRLGYNHSQQKLMEQLGLDPARLVMAKSQVEQDLLERQAEAAQKRGAVNKKSAGKAYCKLGYDPSNEKLKLHLGISQEDLELAKKENEERPMATVTPVKYTAVSGKAAKMLGLNPSKSKMLRTLGVNEEELITNNANIEC